MKSDPKQMSRLLDVARRESRWGVFGEGEPDAKGKKQKQPVGLNKPGINHGALDAFKHKWKDVVPALKAHNRPASIAKINERRAYYNKTSTKTILKMFTCFKMGYLSGNGGSLTLVDLDDVFEDDGKTLKQWVRDLINPYDLLIERSTGKNGLHVYMPFVDADKDFGGEVNNIGLFGSGQRGVLITEDWWEGSADILVRDETFVQSVKDTMGVTANGPALAFDGDSVDVRMVFGDLIPIEELRDCLMSIPNDDTYSHRETWLKMCLSVAINGSFHDDEGNVDVHEDEVTEMLEDWTDNFVGSDPVDRDTDNDDRVFREAIATAKKGARSVTSAYVQNEAKRNGWTSKQAQSEIKETKAEVAAVVSTELPDVPSTVRDIMRQFVYVRGEQKFYCRVMAGLRIGTSVLTEIGGIDIRDERGKPMMGAAKRHEWLRDNLMQVKEMIWDPRLPEYTEVEYVNTWRRPVINAYPTHDISPWLDHVSWMLGDDNIDNCLDWLAWQIQRPGQKLGWALLLIGKQGTGKDLFFGPLKALDKAYSPNIVIDDMAQNGFNSVLMGKTTVLVQEVHSQDAKITADAIYNGLKTYIAEFPDEFYGHWKGKDKTPLPNVCNFGMVSNHVDALKIPSDDRRITVYDTKLRFIPESNEYLTYFEPIKAWMLDGGYLKVAEVLAARDISAMNRLAISTSTKLSMMSLGRSDQEAMVAEALENDVVLSVTEVVALLVKEHGHRAPGIKKVGLTIMELGWRCIGRHKKNKIRHTLWVGPKAYKGDQQLVEKWKAGKTKYLQQITGISSATDKHVEK